MPILLGLMVPIIRSRRQLLAQRGNYPAGIQKISERSQRCGGMGLRSFDGLQIRPRSWDQTASPIWQDQDELKYAVTMHPAQQRQGSAFERMPLQYDLDRRRKAIEVGSVALVRSTLFPTSSFCERCSDTPTSGGSCCTWSAG
jgi:hypothetical protein